MKKREKATAGEYFKGQLPGYGAMLGGGALAILGSSKVMRTGNLKGSKRFLLPAGALMAAGGALSIKNSVGYHRRNGGKENSVGRALLGGAGAYIGNSVVPGAGVIASPFMHAAIANNKMDKQGLLKKAAESILCKIDQSGGC